MEPTIPDGHIVDTPMISLTRRPGLAYALHCQGEAYDFMVRMDENVPRFNLDALVHGELTPCAVYVLNIGGRAIVLRVPWGKDRTGYLIFREGLNSKWKASTKTLLLSDDAGKWGVDDAATNQRAGRILLFVAYATMNEWFELPVE